MGQRSIADVIRKVPVTVKPTHCYIDFLPCMIPHLRTCENVEEAVYRIMSFFAGLKMNRIFVYIDSWSRIPRKTSTRKKRKDSLAVDQENNYAKLDAEEKAVIDTFIQNKDIKGFWTYFHRNYNTISHKNEFAKAFKRSREINSKYLNDCLKLCIADMESRPNLYTIHMAEGEDAEYALVRAMLKDPSGSVVISNDYDTHSLLTFNIANGGVYYNGSNNSMTTFMVRVSPLQQVGVFCVYAVDQSDYFRGVHRVGVEKLIPVIKQLTALDGSGSPAEIEFDYVTRSFDSDLDRFKWFLANLVCFREIHTKNIVSQRVAEVDAYLEEVYSYLSMRFDFGKEIELGLTKNQLLSWSRAVCVPKRGEPISGRFSVPACLFSHFKNIPRFQTGGRPRVWDAAEVAGLIDPWFLYYASLHTCKDCADKTIEPKEQSATTTVPKEVTEQAAESKEAFQPKELIATEQEAESNEAMAATEQGAESNVVTEQVTEVVVESKENYHPKEVISTESNKAEVSTEEATATTDVVATEPRIATNQVTATTDVVAAEAKEADEMAVEPEETDEIAGEPKETDVVAAKPIV